MTPRLVPAAALLVLAACGRQEPTPEPARSDAPPLAEESRLEPAPSAAASASAAPSAPPTAKPLDAAALSDRGDPARLLRYYAAALASRDWAAAAQAWGKGSGVTATTLQSSYDRAEPPELTVGKGEQEGAAGSLYYEAPVTLRFGKAPPERGSLLLRRVNDVDGATPDQLRWHIERSTIGAGG